MTYPKLAVLALSTSAALAPVAPAMASPIHIPIHLHPRVHRADIRINLSLYNQSLTFREVKIDGRVYTVWAHRSITLKAPVGTTLYADNPTPVYRGGDVMLVVTPDLNNKQIDLN